MTVSSPRPSRKQGARGWDTDDRETGQQPLPVPLEQNTSDLTWTALPIVATNGGPNTRHMEPTGNPGWMDLPALLCILVDLKEAAPLFDTEAGSLISLPSLSLLLFLLCCSTKRRKRKRAARRPKRYCPNCVISRELYFTSPNRAVAHPELVNMGNYFEMCAGCGASSQGPGTAPLSCTKEVGCKRPSVLKHHWDTQNHWDAPPPLQPFLVPAGHLLWTPTIPHACLLSRHCLAPLPDRQQDKEYKCRKWRQASSPPGAMVAWGVVGYPTSCLMVGQ